MAGIPIKKIKNLLIIVDRHLYRHVWRMWINLIAPSAMMPMLLNIGVTGPNTDEVSDSTAIVSLYLLCHP